VGNKAYGGNPPDSITQTEYEHEPFTKAALHRRRGSVIVEMFTTWKALRWFNGELREVRSYHVWSCGGVYTYSTNPKYPDSKTLWTLDDDGNCKSPSVFREP